MEKLKQYVRSRARNLNTGSNFIFEGVSYVVAYGGATIIVIKKSGKGRQKEIDVKL